MQSLFPDDKIILEISMSYSVYQICKKNWNGTISSESFFLLNYSIDVPYKSFFYSTFYLFIFLNFNFINCVQKNSFEETNKLANLLEEKREGWQRDTQRLENIELKKDSFFVNETQRKRTIKI